MKSWSLRHLSALAHSAQRELVSCTAAAGCARILCRSDPRGGGARSAARMVPCDLCKSHLTDGRAVAA
eukprot:4035979-Prymnesium_polylepis.1